MQVAVGEYSVSWERGQEGVRRSKQAAARSIQQKTNCSPNRVSSGSERPVGKEVGAHGGGGVHLVLRAGHEPTDAAYGDDRWLR